MVCASGGSLLARGYNARAQSPPASAESGIHEAVVGQTILSRSLTTGCVAFTAVVYWRERVRWRS